MRRIRILIATLLFIPLSVHLVLAAQAQGHEVVTVERGTLGYSARGKVPLRDGSGRVVGEVSVGIATSEVPVTGFSLALINGVLSAIASTPYRSII